jgi:hypothetical protein
LPGVSRALMRSRRLNLTSSSSRLLHRRLPTAVLRSCSCRADRRSHPSHTEAVKEPSVGNRLKKLSQLDALQTIFGRWRYIFSHQKKHEKPAN